MHRFSSISLLCTILFGLGFEVAAEPNRVKTTEQTPDDDAPYAASNSASTDNSDLENSTVGDLVSRSTGVTIKSDGQGSTYVSIRGANPRQLSVTLNGFGIDAPFGPGFNFALFDPSGFDGVRVTRGGTSAGKGSGALTGSIDLFSTRPDNGNRSSITGTVGSFGTRRLRVDSSLRSDDAWGSFAGSYRIHEGDFAFVDRQGTAQTRTASDLRQSQIAGTFGRSLSSQWNVRGDVLYSRTTQIGGGPSEFQQQFADAKSFADFLAAVVSLEGFALTDGASDTAVQLGVVRNANRYFNPDALIGGEPFESESSAVKFGGSIRERWIVGRNLLTSSVHFDHHSFSQNSTTGEVEADRQTARIQIGEEFFASSNVVLAMFVAGAVISDRNVQGAANIAARVRLFDNILWTSTGARSYRVPDLDELYLDTETVRGNLELTDESAWGADTRLTWTFEPLQLTSGFFVNAIESTILFVPITSYLFQAENVRDVLAYGTESQAALTMEPIALSAWHTFTISEFPTGTQSPQQPIHQFGSRLVIELFEFIRTFAEVHGRSETNLDRFGSLTSNGFFTANVGTSFTWRALQLAGSIRNVFDLKTREDSLQRPLPGRSFSLVLKATF